MRFSAIERAHSSSPSSASDWLEGKNPALLTTISMPPNRETQASIAESTCSLSVTSQRIPMTLGNPVKRVSADSSKSSAQTTAPAATKRRTVAWPIPDAPPVTSATLPSSSRDGSAAVDVDLSFACSSSQYSTSNRSVLGSGRQPPNRSPVRIAGIVWATISSTIFNLLRLGANLTIPRSIHTPKRGMRSKQRCSGCACTPK